MESKAPSPQAELAQELCGFLNRQATPSLVSITRGSPCRGRLHGIFKFGNNLIDTDGGAEATVLNGVGFAMNDDILLLPMHSLSTCKFHQNTQEMKWVKLSARQWQKIVERDQCWEEHNFLGQDNILMSLLDNPGVAARVVCDRDGVSFKATFGGEELARIHRLAQKQMGKDETATFAPRSCFIQAVMAEKADWQAQELHRVVKKKEKPSRPKLGLKRL